MEPRRVRLRKTIRSAEAPAPINGGISTSRFGYIGGFGRIAFACSRSDPSVGIRCSSKIPLLDGRESIVRPYGSWFHHLLPITLSVWFFQSDGMYDTKSRSGFSESGAESAGFFDVGVTVVVSGL